MMTFLWKVIYQKATKQLRSGRGMQRVAANVLGMGRLGAGDG